LFVLSYRLSNDCPIQQRSCIVSQPILRVAAAFIREAGLVLICQRPHHKRHGGLWEFPGGKCEPGESDFEATRRELREELDVDVTAVGAPLFEFQDPGSGFLIAFVPVQITGTPTRIEHADIRWVTLADLVTLPLAPSDRRFVEACLVPK
jgi:mutator protein MutT